MTVSPVANVRKVSTDECMCEYVCIRMYAVCVCECVYVHMCACTVCVLCMGV